MDHSGAGGTGGRRGAWAKLRLPVAPAERHLLKGYGPLAVALLAFVLMAVLVPSVAPQQEVVTRAEAGAPGGGVGGVGAAGSGGSRAGGRGASGAVGGASTGGLSGGSGAGAGGGSSTGSGVPVSGGQRASSCPGGSRQVAGDPYSPPCIPFSGNNGGATSPGVTASTITLSYRITSDATSFQQQLAAIGGATFSVTTAQIEQTIRGLEQYFNSHFQFYGRHIHVVFFQGQGSETNELLGEGQQQADADAITAAQQVHAFGELNGTTEPYDDALAQQHVIAFGAPYLSAQWMGARAPYEWSVDTECNDVATTASEFGTKELTGPAAYAGGSLKGQPRKFAVIAPDNPWYQDCANAAIQYSESHGQHITDDIQYQLDLSTLSSQAASVIAKLQDDGVTTIYCGCDPIFPIYLTSRAAEQNYYPEWVVVGVALTDTDIVGQLFDQAEWAHAFGVSYAGPTLPEQDTLGYAAYEEATGQPPPAAEEVNLIYEQMYEVAIGLQMAGPDLTPQTFEAGMRAYPGSVRGAPNAQFGTWSFPPGTYTPQRDSDIIYWNPNLTSTYNGKQGAYVVASPRYFPGQYPTGPPPLPAGFPFTPSSSSS
jgi:hypothetical protein